MQFISYLHCLCAMHLSSMGITHKQHDNRSAPNVGNLGTQRFAHLLARDRIT
jgi:hypothetical protein